jgi:hypothetical protein
MKTKEEIEQLAEKWCTNVIDTAKNKQSDSALIRHIISSSEKLAYKDGYTQCQEDMADKIKVLEEKIESIYEDLAGEDI